MKFKSFTHTQAAPAATWTIDHNLGQKVISDVLIDVNGARTKVLPLSVVHVSDDQLQINFSASYAGFVRLIGIAPLTLDTPSWVPDDITPGVTSLTLFAENNEPLQVDPNGQYLELDD